jgi:hypothetical protein
MWCISTEMQDKILSDSNPLSPGCLKSYTEVTGYLCVRTDLGTFEQNTEITDNTGCLGILHLAVIYFFYVQFSVQDAHNRVGVMN